MPVFPAKKQKQQDKEAAQRQLPGRPVVVDHGDAQNLVAQIVDADQGTVAHGEELVLLQGAVEGVLALGDAPVKSSAQNFKLAALLAGADEARIHHGGLVGRQHPGRPDVRLLKDYPVLVARGDQQKHDHQGEADQNRRLVPQIPM